MNQRCSFHSEQISDHEQRLRMLERAQWKLAGAAATAAGVLSFVGAIAAKMLVP